ncbi:uncharacterized protein AKAME5_001719900, partial [Lates japonicus]
MIRAMLVKDLASEDFIVRQVKKRNCDTGGVLRDFVRSQETLPSRDRPEKRIALREASRSRRLETTKMEGALMEGNPPAKSSTDKDPEQPSGAATENGKESQAPVAHKQCNPSVEADDLPEELNRAISSEGYHFSALLYEKRWVVVVESPTNASGKKDTPDWIEWWIKTLQNPRTGRVVELVSPTSQYDAIIKMLAQEAEIQADLIGRDVKAAARHKDFNEALGRLKAWVQQTLGRQATPLISRMVSWPPGQEREGAGKQSSRKRHASESSKRDRKGKAKSSPKEQPLDWLKLEPDPRLPRLHAMPEETRKINHQSGVRAYHHIGNPWDIDGDGLIVFSSEKMKVWNKKFLKELRQRAGPEYQQEVETRRMSGAGKLGPVRMVSGADLPYYGILHVIVEEYGGTEDPEPNAEGPRKGSRCRRKPGAKKG